jgi:hypothetical protein
LDVGGAIARVIAREDQRYDELSSSLSRLEGLHQQRLDVVEERVSTLSADLSSLRKDFEHFVNEHFHPLQRSIIASATAHGCTCYQQLLHPPQSSFVADSDDSGFPRRVPRRRETILPIRDPSLRPRSVFISSPTRSRSSDSTPFLSSPKSSLSDSSDDSFASLYIDPATLYLERSPEEEMFTTASPGSDMPPLESPSEDSDEASVHSEGAGEELREGFSRSGVRGIACERGVPHMAEHCVDCRIGPLGELGVLYSCSVEHVDHPRHWCPVLQACDCGNGWSNSSPILFALFIPFHGTNL